MASVRLDDEGRYLRTAFRDLLLSGGGLRPFSLHALNKNTTAKVRRNRKSDGCGGGIKIGKIGAGLR